MTPVDPLLLAGLSAGSALLGVVVGGLIRGLVDFLLERHRRRASGRVAARLVWAELRGAHSMLNAVLDAGKYPLDIAEFSVTAWEEHRADLAAVVTQRRWDLVARVYAQTRVIGPSFESRAAEKEGPGRHLLINTQQKSSLETIRAHVEVAITALSPYLGVRRGIPLLRTRRATDG